MKYPLTFPLWRDIIAIEKGGGCREALEENVRIREKLMLDRKGLEAYGPITIVAFGDSVTHGSVAGGEINYETVYWNRLRQKLNAVRNYIPINVINAGIGGITAKGSLARMDAQVLKHDPDLIIVCFGLNDVNGTLEDYLSSLNEIFRKALASGAEVIFLTPNMLNTYVAEDTEARWLEYAAKTAAMQNEGRMDLYIESAVALARELGVTVCDAYAEWKRRAAAGEDTTMLLANRINHPTKEMHALFAELLFDAIMQNDATRQGDESTMYQ